MGNGTNGTTICKCITNALFKSGPNFEVLPDLVESYEYVDDTTYKCKLHEGVKFHDGTELTTEDVKFTYDMCREPDQQYTLAKDMNFIYIEPIDKYNFYLKTDAPNEATLRKATVVGIFPKHAQEGQDPMLMNTAPVGCGAFKFVSWEKDAEVVMEAFDDYFEGRPDIDKLVFKVVPEASARLAGLEAGEIDMIVSVTTAQLPRLEAMEHVEVTHKATTREVYCNINTFKEGPLLDLRVRQAINYAIDQEAIVQGVLDGYASPSKIFSVKNFANYYDELEGYPYDPEKAKALLAEAGYPNGFDLEIGGFFNGLSNGADVAQVIAAQLEEVGIHCTVKEKDNNTVKQDFLAKQASDLTYTSFGGSYNGITFMNKTVLGTDQRYSTYSNPDFDALIATSEVAVEPAAATEAVHAIQKYVYENALILPLYETEDLTAYNTRLQNWVPRQDQTLEMQYAKIVD